MTSTTRLSIAAIALLALAACGRGHDESASGAVDTAALKTSSATPAVGPGVQVTRTDGKSVTRSTRYELTDGNFAKFLAAADSLAALEGRDATMQKYLTSDITDAGSTDSDAGLKWLESNDSVSNAINSAGISVKDYYVQSLAIAAASHFMDNPKAAPPTPTLGKNAEFLRGHTADLARLEALRSGRAEVTVTP